MTLRPIAAMSFPDIEPGGADMARPRYIDVAPTTLLVDEKYQRNLSERSRALIRRVVANWNWRAFKPPVVVEMPDGTMHVIDGQHTAIAAACHPKVITIPVQIVEAEEQEQRADAFVRLNRDRISITPQQMHYAMIAAGDEDALTMEAVCERSRARILKYPPFDGRYEVGDITAIGTLKSIINRRHAMGARRVLDVCVDAMLAPVTADAMKAVEFLLFSQEYKDTIAADDLTVTLRRADSYRDARLYSIEHKIPVWRALASVLYRNTKKVRGGLRAAG